METRCSLCVLILLLSLDAAFSGDSPKGLLCVNDYINTVTCAWHGSAWPPGSNCSIFAVKKIWIVEKLQRTRGQTIRCCRLEQTGNAPPSCSFAFENTEFNNYGNIRSIRLECDGTLLDSLTDYKPRSQIKMNPPTAPVVNVMANDTWISWGANGSWSKFEPSEFHAQLKQKNQRWEEAFDLHTHELKVRVQSWKVTGLCEVRVRVRPNKPPNEYWSNWSPTTSWFVTSERVETSPKDKDWPLDQTVWVIKLVLGLGVVCVSILVLYAGCLRKRGHKKKMVPNPSQYFCTFQPLYEGNLKTWLNPTEAFFVTQPVTGISLVEVSSVFAGTPMKSGPSSSSDNDGNADSGSSSSLSSFYNIGYFLSNSSSSSAPTVRAPAYFTYPDGRDRGKGSITVSLCSSFGTSSSYESLARDPQSPDSGFSFGKEDEAENEDTEAPEDQKCPLLALPPQHHSSPPQPSPPDPSSGDPPTDPAEGCVCRSSSMNVQPCRTGYLTLKELHMTFSNKSI